MIIIICYYYFLSFQNFPQICFDIERLSDFLTFNGCPYLSVLDLFVLTLYIFFRPHYQHVFHGSGEGNGEVGVPKRTN